MKISLSDAAAKLASDPDKLFVKLFEHGSMHVEYYKPGAVDLQSPHMQDELYVIASGTGEFINEDERCFFQTGDVLFVPAGNKHRFENYTTDFTTWVIFYGGEKGD